MNYSLNPPFVCLPTPTVQKYPLFEEINRNNNHVCIHSDHTCEFCIRKIRLETDPAIDEHVTYILSSEVALHNTAHDCWVSFLGKFLNIYFK